jgi:hypothetical protein
MMMFFGVECVLVRGFEVVRGIVVSMLKTIGAGLSFAGGALLVGGNRDVSGSPGVKGVGKGCASGEVSGFYDLFPIAFGTLKIVLMVGECGVVISEWAGL